MYEKILTTGVVAMSWFGAGLVWGAIIHSELIAWKKRHNERKANVKRSQLYDVTPPQK